MGGGGTGQMIFPSISLLSIFENVVQGDGGKGRDVAVCGVAKHSALPTDATMKIINQNAGDVRR